MSRWSKFNITLGYSLLYLFVPLAYLFCQVNALMILPGTSVFTGGIFASFSEIPVLRSASLLVMLMMLAGLVLAPLFAAFRRYLPLYGLMALDIAAHGLQIAHALLEEDSMGTLCWLIAGLLISVVVLAVMVLLLRQPEPVSGEKSACTPCKSAAGDV